ncbi:hypothetical protein ACIP2X_18795 [Streptomyces sp. NPDC089424]|uniref:hypothetical protein n=1 Tax=Streptomyces sp. NPDC089424 TaxID=3365917 RepID=UPI003826592B
MEAQKWNSLGAQWRTPNYSEAALAGIVWYLLHTDPQVPEVIAGLAPLLLLRCFRRDPAGKRC